MRKDMPEPFCRHCEKTVEGSNVVIEGYLPGVMGWLRMHRRTLWDALPDEQGMH